MFGTIQIIFIVLGVLLVLGADKLSMPMLTYGGMACFGFFSMTIGWEAIVTRQIQLGRRRSGNLHTYTGIPAVLQGLQFNLLGLFFVGISAFIYLDNGNNSGRAQLTYRESLRDIEACLRSAQRKLYHMGLRGNVSRNTLTHANQVRDWRIYADFAQALITQARRLYANDSFGVELNQSAYALDSTTINLCLSLFPWAKFRAHKGAVKLHTLLDLRGSIPSLVIITHGKVHDIKILDQLIFEPGAFYIIDRGYLDFDRLYAIHQASAFYVIRAKSNFRFRRLYSRAVDKSTGVQSDQTIALEGFYSQDHDVIHGQ